MGIVAQVGYSPGAEVDRMMISGTKVFNSVGMWMEGGAVSRSNKKKRGAITQAPKRYFTVLNLNFKGKLKNVMESIFNVVRF